ncbi:double-strand break repair protein AddB [Methylocapsa sp. S129]|uniref:double-strand break repair protein AddB n=1 Tax=Methylocapsa sp. S129 TaxID=1641869 RepID=UPI00131B4D95|nr:double-strand break repair protein AddB [Methylocapsa sp. S129]
MTAEPFRPGILPRQSEPPLRSPNLFSIPAGAPFLATLSRALLDGALVEGFPGDAGPLALARATIYVPTQRAARALSQALVNASGGASLILPRIAPLGAFEATQDGLLFEEPSDLITEAPDAVSELMRRMILARLTRAWGQALRGAIARIDVDGQLLFHPHEAPLVAASPAQAFFLAGDLGALIDDMIIEGVPWERLDSLAPGDFDAYWRITLDFLKIAIAQWPAWLAERGLVDQAARGALLVEQEIARLAAGAMKGPVVIAGSTGTNRATAHLIAAIARAPQGAVVLPDLDCRLDEPSWRMIGADGETIAGHPQAALFRLLSIVKAERDDVRPLGHVAPTLQSRARFLSEALRPADSTDLWQAQGAIRAEGVDEALEGVTIIEANDEIEEALALAIAMRAALEVPGKTAALISPDLQISRRVKAELARWGVEVEDSAGEKLGQTAAGAFARLILGAAFEGRALDLLALLAHPLALLARPRHEVEAAARALEIGALRGVLPAGGLDNVEALFEAAKKSASDPHAHDARRRLSAAEWNAAERLLRDARAALAPLRDLPANAPLADFVAAHAATLDRLTESDALVEASGGETLIALMEEWIEAAQHGFACERIDYIALFDAVAAQQRAPDAGAAHPRLHIFGLLEARLLSFDLTLVAGLDETVWPPQAQTDSFLNRPMRAALGLSAPERRIGQTAHDFVAALGAPEAILSRAKKRGGAPTVASRFLQRMGAVAGEAAYATAGARGEAWLALARDIDAPAAIAPIRRPEPRPALELRPKSLSVTRIEVLRRDPYAIYAERILRLQPLEPIGMVQGAREIGTQWHEALSAFSAHFPGGEMPGDARDVLARIAREQFASMLADPSFRALTWPRVERGLDYFLDFDRAQRAIVERILVEKNGSLAIPLATGASFKLTARADRIDLIKGGGAVLIDYKTGAPPGVGEVQVGFAPQLTLEAAMLARGAFPAAHGVKAIGALYLKLGGAKGGETRELVFKDASFAEIVEKHFGELIVLLEQFAKVETPYLSRPYPKFASRFGAYDHLARVKEWSATGGLSDGDGGGS